MRYRKKPVLIQAEQLDRSNGPRLAKWCGGEWIDLYARGDRGEDISHVSIKTLEGVMRADLGDYIIKGIKGEFYPCKSGIFDLTYEAAPHLVMVCGVDCRAGDAVCNNYCNEAPQKGPMADRPPPGPDAHGS
jgi:hypothetical protein